MADLSLSSQLAALEASGLIRLAQVQPEVEYLFRHNLYQDAAYDSLLKADRRVLHRSVGEIIERLYPQRLEEFAPVLALHYDEAGVDEKAFHYHHLAGDAAARRYASSEALMHYDRALEIARTLQEIESSRLQTLYLARGRTLELSSQHAAAMQNYQDMENLARARGDRPLELAASMARAVLYATVNPMYHPERALELSEEALRLAHELHDQVAEAKITWNMLLAYQFAGKLDAAVKAGQRSLVLARQLGLQEQLGLTLNDLGRAYAGLGKLEAAQSALDEARQVWRSLGNLPMLAENLSSTASNRLLSGEYDEALALAGEALRISRETGNLWGQSYSLEISGYVLLERGEFAQGLQALEDAHRLGKQAGSLEATMIVPLTLAYMYGFVGAFQRGIQLVRQILEIARDPLRGVRSALLAILAILILWSGDPDEAEAVFEQAQNIYPGDSFMSINSIMQMAEGEIAFYHQDYPRVVRVMDGLISFLDQADTLFLRTDSLLLKGKAWIASDQLEQARQVLLEAHTVCEQTGARRALWEILACLSQVESRLGNRSAAEDLSRQARDEIHFLADHTLHPDLRDSFLQLPKVRAILEPGSRA